MQSVQRFKQIRAGANSQLQQAKTTENWNRGDFAEAQRHNYNNRSLLITGISNVLIECGDVWKNDLRLQDFLHLMDVYTEMLFVVRVIKDVSTVKLPITPQQLQLYVDTQAGAIVKELTKS